MPEWTKKDIMQHNLQTLKLQNRLSQLSIGTPNDLNLTNQNSSVLGNSAPAVSNNRFFIIKSYSDEDVHKAIKYSIWSSTSKGNSILDEAYMEVQDFRKAYPD
jgi:hypothetical protein